MSTVLSHMPGQTVTIIQQVFNADGYRADGYDFIGSGPLGAPIVARIIFPGFTLAVGYPVAMTKLDTGLYSYSFVLPSGAAAVGMYVVDIYWYHPTTHTLQQDITQVLVTAPFGQYSITAGT